MGRVSGFERRALTGSGATTSTASIGLFSDETGHLFIECKTKRMRLDAKTRADAIALEKDISALADAVVQNYRNIQDCLDGRTDWVPDDRPAFALIC